MPWLPSRKRGLGCIIEGPKQVRTDSFARLGVPVQADARDASLEQFIPVQNGRPVILNQGATSSCVAHAFIAAIHIMETRAQLPFIPCSRLYAYYHARREEDGASPIVFDQGTYLRTCASGLRKFGVPDEKHWEWSEFSLQVNKRPGFAAMAQAHPRQSGRYAKLYETGRALSGAIRSALAAGYPVTFGTRLGVSFLDDRGSRFVEVPPVDEQVAGNHAMCIVGSMSGDNGRSWFRVQNSWGHGWRDAGLCWMSQEYIEWAWSSDFHVIHGWQRLTERTE